MKIRNKAKRNGRIMRTASIINLWRMAGSYAEAVAEAREDIEVIPVYERDIPRQRELRELSANLFLRFNLFHYDKNKRCIPHPLVRDFISEIITGEFAEEMRRINIHRFGRR